MYPEYLSLFDSERGEYEVNVNFIGRDASIRKTRIRAEDFKKLINPETGMFYEKMYFDDYLAKVLRDTIKSDERIVEIVVEM